MSHHHEHGHHHHGHHHEHQHHMDDHMKYKWISHFDWMHIHSRRVAIITAVIAMWSLIIFILLLTGVTLSTTVIIISTAGISALVLGGIASYFDFTKEHKKHGDDHGHHRHHGSHHHEHFEHDHGSHHIHHGHKISHHPQHYDKEPVYPEI